MSFNIRKCTLWSIYLAKLWIVLCIGAPRSVNFLVYDLNRGLYHNHWDNNCINITNFFNYTPNKRSMWGYIVFAFPFVRSFVCTFICTFVRSFVFPSQGQSFCIKVYKTSYFEDPLMDFVHIWHDGRYRSKVFYQHHLHPRGDLGVKVTDLEFS